MKRYIKSAKYIYGMIGESDFVNTFRLFISIDNYDLDATAALLSCETSDWYVFQDNSDGTYIIFVDADRLLYPIVEELITNMFNLGYLVSIDLPADYYLRLNAMLTRGNLMSKAQNIECVLIYFPKYDEFELRPVSKFIERDIESEGGQIIHNFAE